MCCKLSVIVVRIQLLLGTEGNWHNFSQMLFIHELIAHTRLLNVMDSTDLLTVSITANVWTVVFFVARGMIGYALALTRETLGDKSNVRLLADIHDDESWRLPRFCVDIFQSAIMTIIGIAILCIDDVIHQPFRGTFGGLSSTGYAIAIGCYIYRICQDTVLHAQLKHYKVDLVHHLVSIAVCSVFLTYRENALFGAVGLISTASVPGVEVSRLLMTLGEKSGKPTVTMPWYRHNLIVGSVITFVTRLLLPLILGVLAMMNGTPLTMSVPVVAFFFTSLMFFGAINLWLCAMSVRALYRTRRKQWTNRCVSALEGGSQSFPTKHPQQATILAKKNPIPRLAPCANVNLAPLSSPHHLSKNNTLPNNYAKLPVNEVLSLPLSHGLMNNARSSSISNYGEHSEMAIVPVGDASENARPRSVRFLVPAGMNAEGSTSRPSGTHIRRSTISLPTNPTQFQALTPTNERQNSPCPVSTHQRLTMHTSCLASSSTTSVDNTSGTESNTLSATSTLPAAGQETFLPSAPAPALSTTTLQHSLNISNHGTRNIAQEMSGLFTEGMHEDFGHQADTKVRNIPSTRSASGRSGSLSLERKPKSSATVSSNNHRSYSLGSLTSTTGVRRDSR